MARILPLLTKKMIKDFLHQYFTVVLEEAKEYLETVKPTMQVMDIEYDGERFELGHDSKKYLLSNGKVCFFAGNIDNEDVLVTIKNDMEKFGQVILVLKHWDDPKYLDDMLKNHYVEFAAQLLYVASYCTFKNENGKVLYKGENSK